MYSVGRMASGSPPGARNWRRQLAKSEENARPIAVSRTNVEIKIVWLSRAALPAPGAGARSLAAARAARACVSRKVTVAVLLAPLNAAAGAPALAGKRYRRVRRYRPIFVSGYSATRGKLPASSTPSRAGPAKVAPDNSLSWTVEFGATRRSPRWSRLRRPSSKSIVLNSG